MIEVKLNDLYQEVILDHNRNPRNFGKLENPSAYSHGVNPLCGDDFHLYMQVDGSGKINAVKVQGQGCAISKASASMMTEALEGKSVKEAGELKDAFIGLVTGDNVGARSPRPSTADAIIQGGETPPLPKKLKIFEGVKQYPVRVKCATLAWQALADALKDLGGSHGNAK